jgi:integrase
VRFRLKHLHRIVARLADGTTKEYWYVRGGPRLKGEPGSSEFLQSYAEATAPKVLGGDTLAVVIARYQRSSEFGDLAKRTRADYLRQIRLIEAEFGDMPIAALEDKRTRGVFLEWRDKLGTASRRQADYAWAVLALILAWAFNRRIISVNPCERGGKLYRGSRIDQIWQPADEARFYASAPEQMHLPMNMALWTGQRQGDLLRLPWSGYDGSFIRLKQSKTGVRVTIPVGAPLRAALDEAAKVKSSPVILVNSYGRPWTSDGFRTSWAKACAAAGIVGLTFHDLRGTAVTRLAVAGCTEAEIATITGHSLRDVHAILDSNYLHRDPALAVSAIRKLEESKSGTKIVK